MFEELDWQPTPIGAISLRRRHEPRLGVDVYEVRLGETFLMSSLFTASEVALAQRALAWLPDRSLDVVVGGLGLGHTAAALLEDARVSACTVVELLRPVIEWHLSGLVPLAAALTSDPRCRLVEGDFFALAASGDGFDPDQRARRHDAVLVDIDHTPDDLLDARSTGFYRAEGLARLARSLRAGGIFGLWSNAAPDDGVVALFRSVFAEAWAEPVTFDNPLQGTPFTQTVYLARTATDAP